MNGWRNILCFVEFVAQWFLGIIAVLVIILGTFGIYAIWSNEHFKTHYEVSLIWSGIGYLTGAGVLTLAPKLTEWANTAKYYIASRWNSPPHVEPEECRSSGGENREGY